MSHSLFYELDHQAFGFFTKNVVFLTKHTNTLNKISWQYQMGGVYHVGRKISAGHRKIKLDRTGQALVILYQYNKYT